MKKILLFVLIALLVSCSASDKDLYEKADYFVEKLSTTYESYGSVGIVKHKKVTDDGLYQIAPLGRLIIVKILKEADNSKYDKLKKKLENHYKNNPSVNKVYINKGGTVVIDCRR